MFRPPLPRPGRSSRSRFAASRSPRSWAPCRSTSARSSRMIRREVTTRGRGAASMANEQAPSDLKYSKTHEWARIEGSQATIGITAYAEDELGDVVFLELPWGEV